MTVLDPYRNSDGDPEVEIDWEQVLVDVAFYRSDADLDGLPHDPEWDEWEAEALARLGREERHMKGRHDQSTHAGGRKAGEYTAAEIKAGTEAVYRTGPGGAWDPDRVAAVHDPIVNEMLSTGVPMDEPVMVFMGGGSGAGKGTLLRSGIVAQPGLTFDDKGNAVTGVKADSDEVKTGLPEYGRMKRNGDDRAAALAHEESSFIAKRALDESLERGFSTMLDGTGDSGADKMMAKIQRARDKGAKRVVGEYVTIPTEEAVRRATERAERTGRKVPMDTITGTHRAVSEVFPQLAGANAFDELRLWDNSNADGAGPRLVYEKVDGVERVHDPVAYADFLAKAN